MQSTGHTGRHNSQPVPYYLIRSRGWQHGQIAVLKAVLVFLGSIALSALGGMLFGQPPA